MSPGEIVLVYDKQCPACSFYCNLVQIKATVGELTLVNAREDHPVVQEITDAGLDMDQGMVLKMDGALYYDDEAIHMLSLIGSNSGIFNKLNYWMFRSRTRAAFLYPVLKFGRNLLLKLLRRTKINNLNFDNNDLF